MKELKKLKERGVGSILPVPLPMLDGENFNEELATEIRRLANIYAQYLFKKSVVVRHVKEQVALITKLLYTFSEGDIQKLKPLEKIKDILKFLRDELGLTAIYNWLSGNKHAVQILKESGQEKTFVSLWKFYYGNESSDYCRDIKILQNKIKGVDAWFKIVNFLITNSSFRNRMNLTRANGNVIQWNKLAIFSSLLISFTLNSESASFSLEEVETFLREVDDYDAWRYSMEKKIDEFPEDSGLREVFESKEMIQILAKLKTSDGRSIISFSEFVSLKRGDKQKIAELKLNFDHAVSHTFSHPKNMPLDLQLSEARQSFSKIISKWSTETIYKFLLKKPSFVFWLEDDSLLEILVWDSTAKGTPGVILDFANKLSLVSKKLGKTITAKHKMGEVFHAFMEKDEPLNQIIAWVLKNRRIGPENYSSGWEERREQEAYYVVSNSLSLANFSQLLSITESGMMLNYENLPFHICLGIILESPLAEVPVCVHEHLRFSHLEPFLKSKAMSDLFKVKVRALQTMKDMAEKEAAEAKNGDLMIIK